MQEKVNMLGERVKHDYLSGSFLTPFLVLYPGLTEASSIHVLEGTKNMRRWSQFPKELPGSCCGCARTFTGWLLQCCSLGIR